ncbi:MAG: hypothetical protein LBL59_08790 [Xanthomonadaceae bacterium]|nr:hypothetical protein [Xanthomonadaceae bacterium]
MLGQIVLYALTESDAAKINGRRTAPEYLQDMVISGAWPCGAQAHMGNQVQAGEWFPAVVVRVHPDGTINAQVFLDGTDTFWITRRPADADGLKPGHWQHGD